MQKICTGLILAVLVLLPADPAQAGRRRCRARWQPAPCVQCAQSPGYGAPTPVTNRATPVFSYFPDICPMEPISPAADGAWVWSAERHYGDGKNCSNCYIEMSTLTGHYDLYGSWPYACGSAQCEPSSNAQPRARDFDGMRLNAGQNPVNLEFDPVSDMPRGTNAHEIAPRCFVSIEDPTQRNRTRFFIVYSIRVERMGRIHDTYFGHEVPEEELRRNNITPRPIDASQVAPIPSIERPEESQRYVYAIKNQDGRTEFILYLKRD